MSSSKGKPPHSIRLEVTAGDRAYICTNPSASEFQSDIAAAIIDESRTGCGLVVYNTELLQTGDRVLAQLGRQQPVYATVIWREEKGDATALRIGLRYDD